jgi:pantetheine-phosphate adenylyltransferase
MNICLGGTFDPLHRGHRTLFDTAIDLLGDGTLFIGLTSNRFAVGSRYKQEIRDYAAREKDIRDYLEGRAVDYTIVEINERYGTAHLNEEFEAIVVSKETYALALEINQERKKNGLEGMHIFVVDLVRNKQGDVIKGTLIRKGDMDPEGVTPEDRGGGL